MSDRERRSICSTLRGRRILIVEDEALIAFMIEDMLRDLGCQVAGVTPSAKEALAAAKLCPSPDAVLLDLSLGGRHSYEVADALAARGIPFLFVTGYSGDTVAAPHARRPILRKPFLDVELATALASVLGAADRAPTGTPERGGDTHVR